MRRVIDDWWVMTEHHSRDQSNDQSKDRKDVERRERVLCEKRVGICGGGPGWGILHTHNTHIHIHRDSTDVSTCIKGIRWKW